MKEKYDVIVIGAGPSSIFMAYEMIQLHKNKKILLIEQGRKVEDRYCPIDKTGNCIKCKPFCNITSGFSGAGAFYFSYIYGHAHSGISFRLVLGI